MCLIVLFYVVYPIPVCDSHEFPFSGSAKAGGGDTAVLRCCDWAVRRDHKMAVVKCCGVWPYRTPRRLSWGTGCKLDIYICVYIYLCGYLVCGCLWPPGSAAGVTSMRKWLKIRSFTLVEIVIFQNLFLSSRGWKNQLVEIFCGMESSKKKKRKKTNESRNIQFSKLHLQLPHASPCPAMPSFFSLDQASWGPGLLWWDSACMTATCDTSQEVSCQADLKLFRFG